jgi:hypothetical protein
MTEYRIGKRGFDLARKKVYVSTALTAIFIVIVEYFQSRGSTDSDGGKTALMIALAVVAYVTFLLWRGFKKQKKALEAYCVTVTDDQITLRQQNTPAYTLSFMQIKEITKTPKGHFIVKGEGVGHRIFIPSYVDNYDQLETQLQKFGEIRTSSGSEAIWQKLTIPLTVLMLGGMVCLYTVDNKIVIGIAGPLVIAILGYSFYKIIVTKSAPANTKRYVWWLLVIIASILYATITKLRA